MRRLFLLAFALVFICLVSAVSAAQLTYPEYEGFSVTRSLQVEEIRSVSTITGTAQVAYESTLTLTVANAENLEKLNVLVEDDLSSLPLGATLTFSPLPDTWVQQRGAWSFGSIGPKEKVEITVKLDKKITEEMLKQLPAPQLEAIKEKIVLVAPGQAFANDTVVVKLVTRQQVPIANAEVKIIAPSGEILLRTTDANGEASFVALEEGNYRYSAIGYQVINPVLTEIKEPEMPTGYIEAAITPSDVEKEAADKISDVTPIIAGLVVISLIMLGLIVYYSNRKLGDEPGPAPKKGERAEWERPVAGKREPVAEEEPEEKGAAPPFSAEEEEDFPVKKEVGERERIEEARRMTREILRRRREMLGKNQATEEAESEGGEKEEIKPIPASRRQTAAEPATPAKKAKKKGR